MINLDNETIANTFKYLEMFNNAKKQKCEKSIDLQMLFSLHIYFFIFSFQYHCLLFVLDGLVSHLDPLNS